jgi:hypothetical protein
MIRRFFRWLVGRGWRDADAPTDPTVWASGIPQARDPFHH